MFVDVSCDPTSLSLRKSSTKPPRCCVVAEEVNCKRYATALDVDRTARIASPSLGIRRPSYVLDLRIPEMAQALQRPGLVLSPALRNESAKGELHDEKCAHQAIAICQAEAFPLDVLTNRLAT